MKRYFALSRTQHGIIDLATPAFCALIWLGGFPETNLTVLALITAFAGYTAVYALNDLMGYRGDKEKHDGGVLQSGYSVEASETHHPLVQGVMSIKEALAWTGFWFAVALVGAYLLNPFIVLILLAAGIAEIIYCKMLKVTPWRILLSGTVKAAGPIAAIFAVDASPRADFLLLMFAWVFMWEVGGQNIPADWNDVAEDSRIGAKTIPARYGPDMAANIILAASGLALVFSALLPVYSALPLSLPFAITSLAIGYILLLRPALNLWRTKDRRYAAQLFDRASYYPLGLLFLIGSWLLVMTN